MLQILNRSGSIRAVMNQVSFEFMAKVLMLWSSTKTRFMSSQILPDVISNIFIILL